MTRKQKGFTLDGEAVGSYLQAQAGVLPQTDEERALRTATVVHVTMQTSPAQAVALIKCVARAS